MGLTGVAEIRPLLGGLESAMLNPLDQWLRRASGVAFELQLLVEADLDLLLGRLVPFHLDWPRLVSLVI